VNSAMVPHAQVVPGVHVLALAEKRNDPAEQAVGQLPRPSPSPYSAKPVKIMKKVRPCTSIHGDLRCRVVAHVGPALAEKRVVELLLHYRTPPVRLGHGKVEQLRA